jgi:drug/metabolite transporter (DMT)-like permease
MPAVLALLASLLWGTADFLGGTATRRLPVTAVVGGSQLVALLGLVPVALAVGALDEPRAYVLPGLAAGLCGLVALAAFYRALAIGTMGVVAPVAALGVVVPVAAGLVDGESPSGLQLAGITIAVVGVVLASGPELRGRSGALPLVLAAVAAVGFGAVLVLIAEGTESGSFGSVVMTLLTMRLVTVVLLTLLLLAALRSRGAETGVRRADLPVLVAIGALDVGANASFAVAAQSDLISVTAVLASLYPVVTVLLARKIHAERLGGVQLIGVALALVGVVLLAGG